MSCGKFNIVIRLNAATLICVAVFIPAHSCAYALKLLKFYKFNAFAGAELVLWVSQQFPD